VNLAALTRQPHRRRIGPVHQNITPWARTKEAVYQFLRF
jgi:hypothetical protein